MRKKIAEIFIFLICTAAMALVLIHLTDDVDMSGGGFDNYYALPKDTVDVIFFGSSHAGCSVNIPMLWDEAGIAGFTLSASSQPAECTAFYVEEALKTQKPKAVFVETYRFDGAGPDKDTGLYNEDIATICWSDMNMRWSPLYVRMVFEQSRLYGFDLQTSLDLILKYPVLHGDISSVGMWNVRNTRPFSMGYYGENSRGNADLPKRTDDRKELSEKNRESLMRIIELCREKDTRLVLFCAPYPASKKEMAVQNTIADIAAENDVLFVDPYTFIDACGIDFSEDLRSDSAHLNNSGASKVTAYIMELLKSGSDMTDHRGDERYALWDANSRFFTDRLLYEELAGAEDINSYLQILSQVFTEYELMVALSGNYKAPGDDAYSYSLEFIGLPGSFYEEGGAAFISGGNVVLSPRGAKSYKNKLKTSPRSIICEDNAFYLETEKYEPPENGLLLVVYDPVLDRVVDHIQVDVYKGLGPERSVQNEPDMD